MSLLDNKKREIRGFMRGHMDNYETATALAEAAAIAYNLDHALDDPDHWIWEFAIEFIPGN